MSKGSQQQTSSPRDRAPAAPRPKQPGKGDATSNGATNGTSHDAKPVASVDDDHEYAIVPSESAEEDFFARGEVNSSFPPAAFDVLAPELEEEAPESVPLTPAQIERRARLRRIVGGVVGAAAILTAVVGAKALSASPSKVAASDGSLNVPHRVVASIALAGQDEPKSTNGPAADPAAAADPAPSAIDPAPAAENAHEGTSEPNANEGSEGAANQAAAPATARRLPVIDIEIPASTDPATDEQWNSVAKNLTSKDFKGADSAIAELGKRNDLATRETARLARAAWWTANGRQSEVKPVIADLAANATTPSVRQQARDLLRMN
jgi:hypothetical protein